MALKTIGSLWIKNGAKGKFLAGELEMEGREGPRVRVMVFPNKDKKDRQPDYRVVLADDERVQPKKQAPAEDDFESEPF
jgi:hypothetical protein